MPEICINNATASASAVGIPTAENNSVKTPSLTPKPFSAIGSTW